MKKIEKYLQTWVENKLISSDQKDKIVNFENKEKSTEKNKWILYSFLILGVSVIGIGIISIIAANWEKTPPIVKLISNFSILSITGYFIYFTFIKNKTIAFEVLSTIFIILCLASIGLISQIYHTGGQPYQALAVWLVITLPIVLFNKKFFTPALWGSGFVIFFILWGNSRYSCWSNLSNHYHHSRYFAVILSLVLLLFFLSNITSIFKNLKVHNKVLKFGSLCFFLLVVISTDVYLSEYDGYDKLMTYKNIFPFFIMLPPAIISLYFNANNNFKEKKLLLALIILTSLIYIIPPSFFFNKELKTFTEIFAPFYTILSFFLLGAFFSIKNYKKLFNLLTLFIGIRFIVVYFQIIGDLAATGLGLVVSGLIIIGITLGWYKSKNKIDNWIGDHIK